MQSLNADHDDAVPIWTDRLLVVVGGGGFDPAVLRDLVGRGALVVGADGGADAALLAGVVPELVIGDLDSLEDVEAWRERTRVVAIDEQDTTDFEKCLYSVSAPLTVALGMTGGRFDHTLAALHSVTLHGASRRIVLVDAVDAAMALSGAAELDLPAGTRVSIHPLSTVCFLRSEGLRYQLDGLTLAPGLRTGTSNQANGGRVRIVTDPSQPGVYLLILPLAHLPQLLSMSGF
ncbi:MAG: thiamine diphosphokinase [Alphaproteobacteria bacterium]|nr:thiamine diphosphokinase [Alphaproteobacteria bacterium]